MRSSTSITESTSFYTYYKVWANSQRSRRRGNAQAAACNIQASRWCWPRSFDNLSQTANDQAIQCNTPRQTSVLADMNMSIFSKLWLCYRQNDRMGAVSTTTQHCLRICRLGSIGNAAAL